MNPNRRKILQQGSLLGLTLPLASGFGRAFAQPGETLRIGALNPVTGAGSPYGGGMQKAILMASN